MTGLVVGPVNIGVVLQAPGLALLGFMLDEVFKQDLFCMGFGRSVYPLRPGRRPVPHNADEM